MTEPTIPGQDGGERPEISEQALTTAALLLHRAVDGDGAVLRSLMRDILTAVAPDLVRAERDRVRGEWAEELRAVVDAHTGSGWDLHAAMYALVNRWDETREQQG